MRNKDTQLIYEAYLTELFDKPYDYESDIDPRNIGKKIIGVAPGDPYQKVVSFEVDDVENPYRVDNIFNKDDILLNYMISNNRDYAKEFAAEFYPNAVKLENAKVTEFHFQDEDGMIGKNAQAGHKASRVLSTILNIVGEFVVKEQPHVLLITTWKDDKNRISLYDKLIRMMIKNHPGYFYHSDTDGRQKRFWVYNAKMVPYFENESFHELLEHNVNIDDHFA
tara:strand:+ start:1284 stop:1952 length:669 start_codon:yes stop_codon:yes gene_type:complete